MSKAVRLDRGAITDGRAASLLLGVAVRATRAVIPVRAGGYWGWTKVAHATKPL